MPSLKDLRNRIASVKATQKITKAMQMVAAAKLRRAQEAAEAARPYSERMGAVLANITQAIGGGGEAPALMTGTGKEDVHLLVVCTAERGLCGGFNSQIARFARDHIRRLLADGKQVKIICVGKKGFDILRRDYASLSSTGSICASQARLRQRRYHCPQDYPAVSRRRLRYLHAVWPAVQVGDQPDPDHAADHSGGCGFRSGRGCGRRQCRL
jgi:ATP synthase F1 gamma subunit